MSPLYPRPQFEREDWEILNGNWDFRFFSSAEYAEENAFLHKRSNFDKSIVVPFSWGAPLSGVSIDAAGVGWYRRSICFFRKERLFLCFGGVDYICDVYVNGRHVCHHQGGYTYFEVEVSNDWNDGENCVEVRAEDLRLRTQTYGKQEYGAIQGIWQSVWLENRPYSYFQSFRFITNNNGKIRVDCKVMITQPGPYILEANFDNHNHRTTLFLNEGEQAVSLSFCIERPNLWSVEHPTLYNGSISLQSPSGQNDRILTYFGIREIGVGRSDDGIIPRIMLNSKPIFLNGVLDQGFNPHGYFTAPDEDAIFNDAVRIKRLGLNMVRFHIKTEDPRHLYWMDRLGILVMQDIPCFWGEPIPEAMNAYDNEWPAIFERDWNHPSIFSWVMFNETWGLFTGEKPKRIYLPETQQWVRSIYHRAKALDSTRLIEDNSTCNEDHVETDINTWHVYLHGYYRWKEKLADVDRNTYLGSPFNYVAPYVQQDVPMMNSECGMVWGVEGSAGDSDLSWQYHYMVNEFRLQKKLCGYVFTEFRDVPNEFNGFYRIDNTDKEWGYNELCEGMTLRDLHTPNFLAVNAPPCQSISGGASVTLPLVLSRYDTIEGTRDFRFRWVLWYETVSGRKTFATGEKRIADTPHGTTEIEPLILALPNVDSLCYLNLFLLDETDEICGRNFTTFDVHAQLDSHTVTIPPRLWKHKGNLCWRAISDEKLNIGEIGEAFTEVELPFLEADSLNGITLYLEISSKRVLTKDRTQIGTSINDMLDFFNGYKVDRGAFANSYFMTDETRFPSDVTVEVNGVHITVLHLNNDPADARGILSWQSQGEANLLDEAGSYGYLCSVDIPSQMLPNIFEKRSLHIRLRSTGAGGFAIYGRQAGRYAIDPMLLLR